MTVAPVQSADEPVIVYETGRNVFVSPKGPRIAPPSSFPNVESFVNDIGQIYGVCDEVADRNGFFPGKLLFVLAPNGTRWSMQTSTKISFPMVLNNSEIESVRKNPINVTLYYINLSTNKLERLNCDYLQFEGVFSMYQ